MRLNQVWKIILTRTRTWSKSTIRMLLQTKLSLLQSIRQASLIQIWQVSKKDWTSRSKSKVRQSHRTPQFKLKSLFSQNPCRVSRWVSQVCLTSLCQANRSWSKRRKTLSMGPFLHLRKSTDRQLNYKTTMVKWLIMNSLLKLLILMRWSLGKVLAMLCKFWDREVFWGNNSSEVETWISLWNQTWKLMIRMVLRKRIKWSCNTSIRRDAN